MAVKLIKRILLINFSLSKRAKCFVSVLFRLLLGFKTVCIMDNNYQKIVPEDVFVSILDREATEEELWMGLPRNFYETVAKRSHKMRQ